MIAIFTLGRRYIRQRHLQHEWQRLVQHHQQQYPQNKSSVTFTISNISHATLTYDPAANNDPDGDSNGTAITVRKP